MVHVMKHLAVVAVGSLIVGSPVPRQPCKQPESASRAFFMPKAYTKLIPAVPTSSAPAVTTTSAPAGPKEAKYLPQIPQPFWTEVPAGSLPENPISWYGSRNDGQGHPETIVSIIVLCTVHTVECYPGIIKTMNSMFCNSFIK
ncbi:F7U5 [Hyposoter didymator ichnovirus]|nr:F7U1 [Hyposoter didymator ichnovirus]AIK25742.1 F7U5 [Hyposoter didymator ichnovirus]